MQRPFRDWGGNLVAFAIVILLNFLSTPCPSTARRCRKSLRSIRHCLRQRGSRSLSGVRSTWDCWYSLSGRRYPRNGQVTKWLDYRPVQINCLMNAVWMVVWHYDLLILSLMVMLVILATLILIYRTLIADIDAAPFTEHLVLYLPFSLYTGWITLATIANASVLQTSNGWDYVGYQLQWTLLKLALAGAIGASMVLRYRDPVFGLLSSGGLTVFP